MIKEITVSDLNEALEKDHPLFIIDIRTNDVFKKGHIEGKDHFKILNQPYSDMVKEVNQNETQESIKKFISLNLQDQLPKNQPIFVVCYKGNSSKIVVEALKSVGYDAKSVTGGMAAWSSFYNLSEVSNATSCKIYQIQRNSRGCLSYIIESNQEAIIIDPLINEELYEKFLQDHLLKVKAIIDTHMHADHISSAHLLSLKLNAPYYLHPYDAIHPIDMLPGNISYEALKEGQIISFGSSQLKVMHIPGHTLGNLALLLDEAVLFSGDSLFISSIARPDLGGKVDNWAKLHYYSLKKLLKLPDSTLVLPAHFDNIKESYKNQVFARTLKELKQSNNDLKMAQQSYEVFYDFILKHLPTFPKEYIEIKRINLGLLQPSKEEAAAFEIGKNSCALGQK
jgi:glyoxylase-like metal-dependent hydrolase (beta-lactamase superfamily II)/rhodanese-related sulfurtransferase